MSSNERNELLHALVAASNAFHRVLKEHGYEVSYGLDNTNTGIIMKSDVPVYENNDLGKLTILWNLKRSEEDEVSCRTGDRKSTAGKA